MRFHLLFPLAFVSGVHGFAIFLPYLLLVLAAAFLVRTIHHGDAKNAEKTRREKNLPFNFDLLLIVRLRVSNFDFLPHSPRTVRLGG